MVILYFRFEDVAENEGIDAGESVGNHSNKTSDASVTEESQLSPKHVISRVV